MSTEATTVCPAKEEGFEPYRAVSKAAVVSLILAVGSAIGILSAPFLALGLVGAGLGFLAWRSIALYPAELTGKPMAIFGAVLGSVFLVAGTSKHVHEYMTEVPEGYMRISFRELQPDKYSTMPVPDEALQLDGQKIFIKGYLYPDGQQDEIRRFVLVPDMGTCCFGGQPKLTDMIEVTLEDPLRVSYAVKKRKFTGEFKVSAQKKPVDGLDGVYYQLTADWFK